MNTAIIGTMCFALAGGGTLCLERQDSGDFKINCMSVEMHTFYANVKPCELSISGTATVIIPNPTSEQAGSKVR